MWCLKRSSSKSCDAKNIIFNGESYSEPAEIADLFNTFFSEIASEVWSDIPDSIISPDSYKPSNF